MLRGPLTSPTRSTIGFLAHPSLDLTMRERPAQRYIVETPINWAGKMGVSSELGDSIRIFLQEFDGRVGVVCCAFICRLRCDGARTCVEAATLYSAVTNSKDV